mgnify:CR=1 FL=1
MRILAISSSPRKNGNSETLLKQSLAAAEPSCAQVELVCLRDLCINPCLGCSKCYERDKCVINDDFQSLFEKAVSADHLLFSTPVYFMSVSAQAKLFIDRTQCAWARKVIQLKPLPRSGSHGIRTSTVIAVGAQSCKPAFQAIKTMMKYCLPNLGYVYSANLFVSGVDELGAINACQQAIDRAKELGTKIGRELSQRKTPLSTFVNCRLNAAKENHD